MTTRAARKRPAAKKGKVGTPRGKHREHPGSPDRELPESAAEAKAAKAAAEAARKGAQRRSKRSVSPFKAALEVVFVERDEKGEVLREFPAAQMILYRAEFGELTDKIETLTKEVQEKWAEGGFG